MPIFSGKWCYSILQHILRFTKSIWLFASRTDAVLRSEQYPENGKHLHMQYMQLSELLHICQNYSGHVPKIGLFSSINIAVNINSTLMHFEMCIYVYAHCIALHWHCLAAVVLYQNVTLRSCAIAQMLACCLFPALKITKQNRTKIQNKKQRKIMTTEINIRCTFVVGSTRIDRYNITARL